MWSDSFYNVSCYSMDFIIRPGRLRLLGFEIEIALVVVFALTQSWLGWLYQDLYCTGTCHDYVPILKVVSSDLQSTDGLTVCIGQDRDSHQLGTLSTILTMKPIDTLLRDLSCRQSWHLSTPSHPQIPPEWPSCWQAQCRHWFTV